MNRRDYYRPMIAAVIAANKDAPLSVLRRRLREAFPHGARKMHPYKIWLDESHKQLLENCLPPGFSLYHLRQRDALDIMADWWEERGDLPRARLLRTTKIKPRILQKGERRSIPQSSEQKFLWWET